jgi:hypothetical protein
MVLYGAAENGSEMEVGGADWEDFEAFWLDQHKIAVWG